MKQAGLIPERVLCSPAVRTRKTLAHVLAAIGTEIDTLFVDALYEADCDQLMDILRERGGRSSPLLLVGHNPAVQAFATRIATDGEAAESMAKKFPTAALAVFDASIGQWAGLDWRGARLVEFTRPRDLP